MNCPAPSRGTNTRHKSLLHKEIKKPGPHRGGRAQPGRTTLARDFIEKAGTEFGSDSSLPNQGFRVTLVRWKRKKHSACRKTRIPKDSLLRQLSYSRKRSYKT